MPTAEIELIESQEYQTYKCYSTVEFLQQVTECKYPKFKKTRVRLLSVFSTAYCSESLFSVVKFVKSKYHASLTNEHLKELIYTALISYHPDFQKLPNNVDTHNRTNVGKISKKIVNRVTLYLFLLISFNYNLLCLLYLH